MRFTKMEGLGNDYVYVDGFGTEVADPPALARRVSDRHFGVGADGLILILPSERADVRMRMHNADGSPAEMCGNGLRCVAWYACRHGLVDGRAMTIETDAGLLPAEVLEETGPGRAQVRIEMGIDPDPLIAFRESGYLDTIRRERTSDAGAGLSSGYPG